MKSPEDWTILAGVVKGHPIIVSDIFNLGASCIMLT